MTDGATLKISSLKDVINGQVIEAGDPDYDAARSLFYPGFDLHPTAIVRVADIEDVSQVVTYARLTGSELAVRSGGHSVRGHSGSEGGIVLDLSAMNGLDIDVEGRTAWAEAGLTTGEYTKATAAHGLATGFGDTGSVGIGGITLGGGVGWLVRKFGLTIDDLLAAEVVTADGQILTADPDHHPDLFWALRGGGGNFGAVTRFQFRLHELDQVVGGMMMLPASAELVARFVSLAEAASEELSTVGILFIAPPLPFIPSELHGKLVFMVTLVYAGDPAEGTRVIDEIKQLGPPLIDMVQPGRYQDMFPDEEMGFHPAAAAGRTLFLEYVDEAVVQKAIDTLAESTADMTVVQVRVLGGAVAQVSSQATAFAHRQSRIMVNLTALFNDLTKSSEHDAWAESLARSLRQTDEGAYVNFLVNDNEEQVRRAYPDPTWDRLAEIKGRYDPTNLFSRNFNIPPKLN